jgi:2-polyprenyl-6-hydroxyphenyl methylase/3-demethylubiquinone-9 3-methyltransferase
MPQSIPRTTSIAPDEIAQFSRHAEDWWNPDGVFKPLHQMNPVRLAYIRDQVCEHFRCDTASPQVLRNLKVLDVGCGGGLLTEPMARMGGIVTGLDASAEGIAAARAHAKMSGLKIDYQIGSVEEVAERGNSPPPARGVHKKGDSSAEKTKGLAKANPKFFHPLPQGERTPSFDLITALEIVEHVADLDSFIAALSKLLKPNGLLIMSTLNRTPKSFLLGIVAAEYVLGWVPKGTHQWQKFVRPSELVQKLENNKMRAVDLSGVTFNPMQGEFVRDTKDLGVNYMLTATHL